MPISQTFDGSWFHRLAQARPDKKSKPESFDETQDDAEVLLNYAAESGSVIAPEIVTAILTAKTAGAGDLGAREKFYDAYAKLAKQFGEVTASTIRSCASMKTRRTLRFNRMGAMVITAAIAVVSVATFMADSMSNAIVEDTTAGNTDAAKLRAALTPLGGAKSLDPIYVEKNPCDLLTTAPSANTVALTPNVNDIEALQHFAVTLRDLHGQALKLNWLVSKLQITECDPLGACSGAGHDVPTEAQARAQTQIEPAILNYNAEVLCKIGTYQTIRNFATNVRADYLAVMGAITAYALPIAYAWLGAYAFRLRSFAETIRKRTYHPSFADSARMITAVIAGAIVGLFKPAQGMALSPLAVAFLAGYGVELFFKFLDTLINAFGTGGGKPANEARQVVGQGVPQG